MWVFGMGAFGHCFAGAKQVSSLCACLSIQVTHCSASVVVVACRQNEGNAARAFMRCNLAGAQKNHTT